MEVVVLSVGPHRFMQQPIKPVGSRTERINLYNEPRCYSSLTAGTPTPNHSVKTQVPTRPCKVPGWGLFQVPRHIVPVDSVNPDTGWLKSAGWQVRYGERPWRYFRNSKERPKREAEG